MQTFDPDLSGPIIEKAAARKALKMGRDAFDAALEAGEIPSIKIRSRRKVLGVPFRKMLGIAEVQPAQTVDAA